MSPIPSSQLLQRLPPKFVRYYGNELAHAATLVVPTGRVWPMELTKQQEEIFFDKGWPRFLEHYSITDGQFLIFQYEGDSRFKVRICDTSCCEIRYRPDQTSNDEELRHKRGETSQRRQCKLADNGTHTSTKGKGKMRAGETEFIEPEEEETGCGEQFTRTFARRVRFQPVEEIDLDATNGPKTNEVSKTTRRGFYEAKGKRKECFGIKENKLSCASPASQRAIQEAEKIEAHNPCFLHLLTAHDMEKYQMYVPAKFAKRYLNGVGHQERILIQDSHGRKWLLGFTHKNGHYPAYFLNVGFGEFVEDNMLREGDVLHFELVGSENPALKVHIFHAQEFSG
ncbi:hypothetical protein Tsubulata_023091 [Turnera subulata]|uniref:TF-B3 domain-containing protein n=1 Tax=Turnera subulata TaxID=218843 RepID=A0A9Q0FTR4_9ROSI|nr:hypothetical protein Tsubulata_023091 [Turnera subulata]